MPSSGEAPGTVTRQVLKSAHARTVRLEIGAGDAGAVVIKRFHHPQRWQALRDGARSERERELLALLHERGVRVPRPLGRARIAGGWEVRMELVPGARPLAVALEHPAQGAVSRARLLLELGRLLAGLHAAAIDHPDLHLGNVLVDESGLPWLVDFHHARRRRRSSPAILERDLCFLAAAAREVTSPLERARVLLAWRRALPPALAPPSRTLRRLLRKAEGGSRELRRRLVERGLGRWTRESGVVSCEAAGRGTLHVRRDLAEERAAELRALARSGEAPSAPWIVARGQEARPRWLDAARALEHHLPHPRPAALLIGEPSWAAFEPGPEPPAPERMAELLADRGLSG